MSVLKKLHLNRGDKIKTSRLEHELDKLIRRVEKYKDLVAKKDIEFKSINESDFFVNGQTTNRELQDKYFELRNCISMTESKIKHCEKKMRLIEEELVDRMLTGGNDVQG